VKIILHYRASPGFRRIATEMCPPNFQLSTIDETDDERFSSALRDVDVIFHVLRPLAARDIEAAPKLKLIQKIGVGVNTIDLQAAKGRSIAVCNMPGTNTQAVAEMTLTLMLSALRRAVYFDGLTRAGEGWRPDVDQFDRLGEISGRTVGLVGYGAVPSRLAPVLTALGADVVYTARSQKADAIGRFLPLDELLQVSDIVSLHCPATDETRGMLSRDALQMMKKGAVLVNTARGELVDEAALTDLLSNGHLAAAGLDVFAREPVSEDIPLFHLRNVVLAPHIAWLTPETLRRSMSVAMENCRRLQSGRELLHRVV
jgi:phosphoglycerate dehydrogenase-like enzyme